MFAKECLMSTQTILIIEDEPSLIEILSYNLSQEGFEILTASDGLTGLKRAQKMLPDLIILDLMLPEMDGLQICRQLRSSPLTDQIRILMLTAKSEETDEIVGFQMGADDYVTKPFKIKPLLQRIKALLRRPTSGFERDDVQVYETLQIDKLNHTATLDNEELSLTPTEFRLLWTFCKQPNRTYTRTELMDICRGEDANSTPRTIDVHIRALRQKLGEHANWIETVRGIGYRFRGKTQ